jgi:hypothetical protein
VGTRWPSARNGALSRPCAKTSQPAGRGPRAEVGPTSGSAVRIFRRTISALSGSGFSKDRWEMPARCRHRLLGSLCPSGPSRTTRGLIGPRSPRAVTGVAMCHAWACGPQAQPEEVLRARHGAWPPLTSAQARLEMLSEPAMGTVSLWLSVLEWPSAVNTCSAACGSSSPRWTSRAKARRWQVWATMILRRRSCLVRPLASGEASARSDRLETITGPWCRLMRGREGHAAPPASGCSQVAWGP